MSDRTESEGETAKDKDGWIPASRRGILSGIAGLGLLSTVGTAEGDSRRADLMQTTLEFGGTYSGNTSSDVGLELNETGSQGPTVGVRGIQNAPSGNGVRGVANASTGVTFGVFGLSKSVRGRGITGRATAKSGATVGLLGVTDSIEGTGLQGDARASTGNPVGLRGSTVSPDGTAVLGNNRAGSGTAVGVVGASQSPDGLAIESRGDARVEGQCTVTGDVVVQGQKNFAHRVETPSGPREVRYTAVEAGQAHTEVSDVAELEDGRAEIELPEHFRMVTSEEGELTVQLTPYASEQVHPQVVDRSLDRIVVEDFGSGPDEYAVAYTVKGIRDGFEDKEIFH